jgi:hypothetical protein
MYMYTHTFSFMNVTMTMTMSIFMYDNMNMFVYMFKGMFTFMFCSGTWKILYMSMHLFSTYMYMVIVTGFPQNRVSSFRFPRDMFRFSEIFPKYYDETKFK